MLEFLKLNKLKFLFRTAILVAAILIGIIDYSLLTRVFYFSFMGVAVYHVLWAILMIGMIQVCIPVLNHYVSCGKLFERHYKESEGDIDPVKLKEEIFYHNKGAIRSGIFWLLILTIIGTLYYTGVIDKIGVVLIGVFFYWSDQFCINFWCPFRSILIGNKCCNVCRIYNWGHFMIVSPLIFIPSFWTYSLVIVAIGLLIQWEWQHYRYPERFHEVSNDYLKCQNCLKAKCGYIK